MLSILDQALALAATGTPVFPCRSTPDWKPTDKTPACLNGFKDATTDPERIRALFGVDAAKLIGVPTGAVSGFDILDFDPRHGGSEDAETAMKLPITKIHITQSGGKHYFFKSSGVKMPNSQGKVAPGVDVRGDGGYIIWWPCIGCEVYLDEDIAPWPATLDAVARAPKPRTKQESRIVKALAAPSADSALRVLADAVAIIEACLEGNRHSTIRDLCMTLASLINADLLDHDDARAAVLAAAEVCGAENMQNVENLFDSAVEKAEPAEINDGSELGALPPLEIEVGHLAKRTTSRSILTRGSTCLCGGSRRPTRRQGKSYRDRLKRTSTTPRCIFGIIPNGLDGSDLTDSRRVSSATVSRWKMSKARTRRLSFKNTASVLLTSKR